MSESRDLYAASTTSRQVLSEISTGVAYRVSELDRRVPGKLADLAIDWLIYLRVSKGLAAQTIDTYCKGLIQFWLWLSSHRIELEDVSVSTINDWQKSLYVERRLSNRTRRQQLVLVRQFFVWLKANRGGINPAEGVPSPKISKLTPRKYTTPELKKLFEACRGDDHRAIRDYALILFFYATGARREETSVLQMDQLTFLERVGRVKFIGKGAKEREVSFEQPVADALRRWLTVRDTIDVVDQGNVWCNVDGQHFREPTRMVTIENIFRRRCKQAKIPHRGLHALRVTFATDLYDSGERIEVIQNILGHESVETTRGYIVVSETHRRVKMPANRINALTGETKNGLPLWIQKKQQANEQR